MKDLKINNYKIDSRDTLTFKVTLKVNDYNLAERELLKWADSNWNTLDMEIIGLVLWDENKERKKKLNNLAMNMLTYADKSNTNIEELKNKLYGRYWVKSRSEMKLEDIEKEIESYKMGIFEFSN